MPRAASKGPQMSFFATCAIIYCCPNQSGKNKSNPIIVLQWPLIAALNTSNLLGTKQWAKSNFGSNNIGFNVSLILSLAQLSFFLTQWILAVIPLYTHFSSCKIGRISCENSEMVGPFEKI